MMGFSYESRHLKRPKLGPPDVYPQQPKQKEDDLTTSNVKHGFPSTSQLDEFGSARQQYKVVFGSNNTLSTSRIGAYFNGISQKKEELNTLPDSSRKKQQIGNKEHNFWPVTVRSKSSVDSWFKDLAGSQSLQVLSKKIPSFNKKEEMIVLLCEYNVPVLRATWFLKLSSANVTTDKTKTKKLLPDPSQEWTSFLLRYMKEQLMKIQEAANTNRNTASVPQQKPPSPPPTGVTPAEERKNAIKLWNYLSNLTAYMYQEILLEQDEVLTWIIDMLDRPKIQPGEEYVVKLLLIFAMQHMSDFSKSENFSRRLAFVCARRISHMVTVKLTKRSAAVINPPSSKMAMTSPNGRVSPKNSPIRVSQSVPSKEVSRILEDYQKCCLHKDTLMFLSTIIQVITLDCPTALVWNDVSDSKSACMLNGSPLDLLPCRVSTLPLPRNADNNEMRSQLRKAEESVRQRSMAAEKKWYSNKWHQSSAGSKMHKILSTLDTLDRHSFDRIDEKNSLDTLYRNIFPAVTDRLSSNLSNKWKDINAAKNNRLADREEDETLVHILCEWAVSNLRTGEHRALAVCRLLQRRQYFLLCPGAGQSVDENFDYDELPPNAPVIPIFQKALFKYLDCHAPVLDGSSGSESRFSNLVYLFSQLIRNDVFSHDAYMCSLISRGDITCSNVTIGVSSLIDTKSRNLPNKSAENKLGKTAKRESEESSSKLFDIKPRLNENGRVMDCDDSTNIDDDLDKILQSIKQEQQKSMEAPDSPRVDGSFSNSLHNDVCADLENKYKCKKMRHLLYTTHFPLPQDDEGNGHDFNQRHVLLYGVGKGREEIRHTVKKICKEICRLFGKKFSIDVADGGKVKKHSKSDFNFESVTTRVQNLSYFDQHVVTYYCSNNLVETMNSFATGNSYYLPVQEHVAFIFDLMELAMNIDALIDLCIMILMEIPEIEAQLMNKGLNLVNTYTSSLVLYILGVLRRYHSCLLMSRVQIEAVFEGLLKIVKNVQNPGECSTVERCVFSHLYDLYLTATPLLKSLPSNGFQSFSNTYYLQIGNTIYKDVTLPPLQNERDCGFYNSNYMDNVIRNYRRGVKIERCYMDQLNDPTERGVNNRYSLVCNVIRYVCNEKLEVERLNDMGVLCAELTASCNALTAEWLAVLLQLCRSSSTVSYYDVLSKVNVEDLRIHNSLAVFTAILVARNCFSLENFVSHVALPSLLSIWNEGRREASTDAEAGARLTCHLLLRLFKTSQVPQPGLYSVCTSPHPMLNTTIWCIKQSCDRHLLAAAHNKIDVGALLAVLKAIIVVGDATAKKTCPITKKSPTSNQIPNHSSKISSELSISHILGTSDMPGGPADQLSFELGSSSEKAAPNLSEFAKFVLREICSQDWVLERCLKHPEKLCDPDFLLDSMLTNKQARRLLHMICYPGSSKTDDPYLDDETMVVNIIQQLDQWTLRISWLDMQLMYKQFPPNCPELIQWLDMVAKAILNVFQVKKNVKSKSDSMWLVAPLVAKLPSAVQGRVLRVAGEFVENIKICAKVEEGSPTKSASKTAPILPSPQSLIHHQPFLSLVLTCLKEQDDQRDGLLASLYLQLSQFLQLSKEEKMNVSAGLNLKVDDGLLLRFSLVGGMFNTIKKNSNLTVEWAVLLVNLVTQGVINLNVNVELFNTVIDMLATLIHSAKSADMQNENLKKSDTLIQKLKKEVGEKKGESVKYITQLLPLPKQNIRVIATEQIVTTTDTKGARGTGHDTADKKGGLQVTDIHEVNAWDIQEGSKNPASLSWSWFSGIRTERKPLWYEENHRLLKFHTHSLVKPSSYYLEPLQLPPEDMEVEDKPTCPCPCCTRNSNKAPAPQQPPPPIMLNEMPPPAPIDPAMRSAIMMKRFKTPMPPALPIPAAKRKRQPVVKPGQPVMPNNSGPSMPPPGMHPPPGIPINQRNVNYGGMPVPGPGPTSNGPIYNNQGGNSGQQWPPGNYPQTPYNMPNSVGRMEKPLNQSKQALSQMLRLRNPNATNQYVGGGNIPPFQGDFKPSPQYLKQQLRAQSLQLSGQSGVGNMQQSMYNNGPQVSNFGNFGNQSQGQMLPPPVPPRNTIAGNMYPSGHPQSTPNSNAMQFNMRSGEYPSRTRSPYLQAPNVAMNAGPPFSRTPNQTAQQYQQQQLNVQRYRQMMSMQQQASGGSGGPTPALMAHLQRNLPQSNKPQSSQAGGQPPPY